MKSKKLALFLRNARKKAGLTQTEVAEALGYGNSQFVSNWERARSTPPLNAIRQLSKMYHVSMDELFQHIFEVSMQTAEESLRKQYSLIKKVR